MASHATKCRAIVVKQFGGPEVMHAEEKELCPPAAGEVLVCIKAAGVNPVDTYIRSGQYARLPDLPYTPGMDGAGVVQAVGPGVTKVAVGQRVYLAGSMSGTYATLSLAKESQVWALPEAITFEQGAGLGTPYQTAYRALFKSGHVHNGSKVLVHGASGGVGLAAVQWAKAVGAFVIGTASSQQGREIVLREGADMAVDHTHPAHVEEIKKLSGGGVDIIVEMLANVNLGMDLTMLNRSGCISVVGSRGTVEINPRDLMAREAEIKGVMIGMQSAEETEEVNTAIHKGLVAGTLRPCIGHKYSLARATEAHGQVVAQTGGAMGKVIITME